MVKSKIRSIRKKAAKINYQQLYKWNVALAAVHGVQAIAILAIGVAAYFPVVTRYLSVDTLATRAEGSVVLVQAQRTLFEVNMVHLVALFFVLSAVAHAVAATVYKKRYQADLKKGINRLRWVEYAFSASTMIVAIALLSGIYEISSLVMLFSLVAIMNLLGLAMEVYNKKTARKANWLAYWIGCLAAIVPWLVIAAYLAGASLFGEGQIPTFVYWIYVSLFVLFNCFAINMYLQYKKVGKWSDYLYGERTYMILSLVAKTALAWQVFAGALRP